MFGTAGTLLNVSTKAQNQGKVRSDCLSLGSGGFRRSGWFVVVQAPRYRIDAWDQMMMDRDRRLTGHKRGQKVRFSYDDASRLVLTLFLTFTVDYGDSRRLQDE